MKTIEKLLQNYYAGGHNKHERFGQYFVNRYISQPWPELFHERDVVKAVRVVEQWLIDFSYVNRMPKQVFLVEQ